MIASALPLQKTADTQGSTPIWSLSLEVGSVDRVGLIGLE